MTAEHETPADDVLRGVEAIAEFTGEPVRRTQYLLETAQLPAGKIGRRWIGSKRRLRQFYAERTGVAASGEAA